jgi:hexosaminidase
LKRYHFIGDPSEVRSGLSELEKEGCFAVSESGFPVEVRRGAGLCAESDGKRAVLTYDTKISFFRALGLLLEHEPGEAFRTGEKPAFRTCGVMFDLSRNAVLNQNGFEFFIRRMALMGLNMAMLYLEDTYEIPGEPYFGWMRGRYTQEELRRMDDYAFAFGIELIPAIQTLAHLEKALRWNVYAPCRDTNNILLAGDEAVLALVEKMIRAASAPFRTRRIHLGMDEAEGLGSGAYLRKNGYHSALDILSDHLQSVLGICRKLGLEPMIWSDMYLKLLSSSGTDYYDVSAAEKPLPPEVTAKMPADVSLVYWDYYHEEKSVYEALLKKHRRFPNDVIFAGGASTWYGVSPALGKAFACTKAGLAAAKEGGVSEVFCTLWGDDGSETNYLTALPVLQLYAEYNYGGEPSQDEISSRFTACCGGDFEDFMSLRLFDETPGVEKDNPHSCNPSKYLLYQDVLLGLFDRHAEGLPLDDWYAKLMLDMEKAGDRNPQYAALFRHYRTLAEILSQKALLGVKLTAAYRSGRREEMKKCADLCGALSEKLPELQQSWSTLWLSVYKPFGMERIDQRLGGDLLRLKAAENRVRSYLDGEIASIPELEQERLFIDGRTAAGKYPAASFNSWDRIVSVG